jgi:hypothetical protein
MPDAVLHFIQISYLKGQPRAGGIRALQTHCRCIRVANADEWVLPISPIALLRYNCTLFCKISFCASRSWLSIIYPILAWLFCAKIAHFLPTRQARDDTPLMPHLTLSLPYCCPTRFFGFNELAVCPRWNCEAGYDPIICPHYRIMTLSLSYSNPMRGAFICEERRDKPNPATTFNFAILYNIFDISKLIGKYILC